MSLGTGKARMRAGRGEVEALLMRAGKRVAGISRREIEQTIVLGARGRYRANIVAVTDESANRRKQGETHG